MKHDLNRPTPASVLPDLIADLHDAERAAPVDLRRVGRLEGAIAAAPVESNADAALKLELLLGMLPTRPDSMLEDELARTSLEFLKAAR